MFGPRHRLPGIVLTSALTGALLLLGISAGCSVRKNSPGTTYGKIFVDSPEVHSRERLVGDRLEQDAWLRRELEKSDQQKFGFQGLVDLRNFTGVQTQTQTQADPLAVQLYRVQNQSAIEQQRRQMELDRLEHEKQLLQLQQQIDDLKNGNQITPKTGGGDNPDDPNSGNNGESPGSIQLPGNAADNALQSFEDLTGQVPDPSGVTTTRAQASPLDTFRDKLAYREEIRNEILENSLDDRHDLDGNTLYRLKFDATLLPESDTSAWAVIEVHDLDGATCTLGTEPQNTGSVTVSKECVRVYQAWLQFLRDYLDREYHARLSTVLSWYKEEEGNGEDPAPEKQDSGHRDDRFFSDLVRWVNQEIQRYVLLDPDKPEQTRLKQDFTRTGDPMPKKGEEVIRDARAQRSLVNMVGSLQYLEGYQLESADAVLAKAVQDYLVDRYMYRLGLFKYAHISGPSNPPFGIDVAHFSRDIPTDEGRCNVFQSARVRDPVPGCLPDGIQPPDTRETGQYGFCQKLSDLSDAKTSIFAYAATPKESVERISDVAANRRSLQALFNTGFLLGKVALDNFTKFARQSEGLFHAARRQPLVVGFSNHNKTSSFGWILGPVFGTNDKGSQAFFRHRPIQNPLAAVISVPSWWRCLDLKVRTYWRDEEGREFNHEGKLVTESNGNNGSAKQHDPPLTIPLPGDPHGILDALTPSFVSGRRQPVAQLITPMEAEAGSAAELVLKGNNLWRSPVVTLNGQRADRISVLPSMEAIVASFERVDAPAGWDQKGPLSAQEVRVWTSEGDALAGRVTIHPPARLRSARLSVKVASGILIPGEDLQLEITHGALPKAYSDVKIAVRPQSSSQPWKQLSTLLSFKDTAVRTSLKTSDFTGFPEGLPIEAALQVTSRPQDSPEEYRAAGHFYYYSSASNRQVKVEPATADVSALPAEVTGEFPLNFRQAFRPVKPERVELKVTAANQAVGIQVDSSFDESNRRMTWKLSVDPATKAAYEQHICKDPLNLQLELRSDHPALKLSRTKLTVPKKSC